MGIRLSLDPLAVGSCSLLRKYGAVATVLVMLLSAIPILVLTATGDPYVRDNGDMTRSVLWNFTDPADYGLYNASVSGGLGTLLSENMTVDESTTADYLRGNLTNIDLLTVPDSMAIDNTTLPVQQRLLQPGPEGFDSYVDEWFPSWTPPDGGSLVLNSQYDPTETYNRQSRIVMRFDLSSVPAGAVITEATLSLYEKSGRAQLLNYTIHAVETSWDEQHVSWRTRDATHSWMNVGGDYSSESFSRGTVDSQAGWHTFDLTRLVDLWVRGAVPNTGFIIVPQPALGDASKTFVDCEITNKPDERPILSINFTTGEANATYESVALGQGTNSTFTIASWGSTASSKASDEFAGTLSPRWNWSLDPSSSGGSVNLDRPGWLNITGSPSTYLPDDSAACNFLQQEITNNFTMETSLQTYFSESGMGAGLMAMSDPLSWIAVYVTGIAGDQRVVAEMSKGGNRSTLGSIAFSSPTIGLMITRMGSGYDLLSSPDGVDWTTVAGYSPQYDLATSLSMGPFVFSNGSAQRPVVELDFVRILPANQLVMLEVNARAGNSTSLSDPSWLAWGPSLSPNTGATVDLAGKYLQYRVVLRTCCGWVSPVFSAFESHYELFAANGTIRTGEMAPPSFLSWDSMTVAQSLAAGDIEYSYSTDGGGSWNLLGSGSSFALGLSIAALKIKAEITTDDTSSTPSIDSIELVYTITHSYFYVNAPPSVQAGEGFTVYIEPKDTANNTAPWEGQVTLHAVDPMGAEGASVELSVTQGQVPIGGQLTISTESYNVAETIRILVTGGGASGLSDPIAVVPGPAAYLTIEPDVDRLEQNTSTVFTASVCDAVGNNISGAPITWTADFGLGTLNSTTGSSVNLTTVLMESSGYLTATSGTLSASLLIMVSGLLHPPVIDPDIPAQSKPEDYGSWTLDLGPYVSDSEDNLTDLRWYAVNETVVKITGENRTGDLTVTFTTILDLWGTNLIELWVVDSDRMGSKVILTVDITPVNDPPKIEPIDPIVVRYDDPYQYNLAFYVTDVETTAAMLSLWVDSPSAQYVQISGLWLTFLYPEALNGTQQTVFLSVSDGEYTASTVIQVSVTDDHVPRTLGAIPDQVLLQGEVRRGALQLSTYFYDPDGANLYYTNGNTHVGIVIQTNHSVDFYAPNDWAGQEYVVFTAKDELGARAEAAMRITVVAVNHAPTIANVPDLVVRHDEPYSFDLTPYVGDIDDEIGALTVTVTDPRAWTVGALLCLNYPGSMTGSKVPVLLTVSDGALTDSWTINVTISNDHPPELVEAAPDHTFLEDNPLNYPVVGHLDDFFADSDGDTLSFSGFVSVPNITAEIVGSAAGWSVRFTPDTDWYGIANLTFRARDGDGAIAETTVLLNVRSVPDQPRLELPAFATATEGSRSLMELTRNVSDPDSEATDLRWSMECGYPEFMSVHGGIVVLDFPTDFLADGEKSRTLIITVYVTDQDNLIGSDNMTVTVLRHVVVTKQNPMLWVVLAASGVAVTGLSAYAISRRRRPFVVHDMMLIHNDGFLISRYAHHLETEIDDQVMSGMLTAVLNFVEDSMATSAEALKTFGFKEYQVLVSRGDKVFTAVVFDGDMPEDIDKPLKAFLQRIEKVYRKKLANWTGDIETDFAGVEVLIQAWVNEHSRNRRKMGGPSWVHTSAPKEPGDISA